MTPWIFDEPENKIARDNRIAQITPKASAVLACLMRRRGEIVTKDDILAEVWVGLNVTEDLIREYIFDIRAALGDDARNPTYIETVRGRGFRLIGGVVFARQDGSDFDPVIQKPTVAVLRAVAHRPDRQTAAIADRLVGSVISGLAFHRDIEVVSGQSSLATDPSSDARDTAARLSAGYLLESSVGLSAGALRASFHLIDGLTGRHVWAQRFEAAYPDEADAIEQMANKVVNALAGWHGELHLAEFRLASRKPPGKLTAFEHFIRGCDLELNFDQASVRRSLQHLDQSLELDPNFARCWVVKAIMLQWSYDMFAEKDPEVLRQSAQSMARALVLDPRDPLTLSLMALQHAREGDMAGAMDALDRAAPGCDADADACVCIATALCVLCGDFDRSRQMFENGVAINPVYPAWYRFVEARIRFFFGEYERSVAASKSGPQRVSSIIYRCLSQTMLGQPEAARASHADLLAQYPGFDFDFYANYFPIADPTARARYQAAVDRLMADLDGKGQPLTPVSR